MVFPTTAWWSAGLTTPQGRGAPFAGRNGGMQDLGTLPADTMERGFWCFRRRRRGGRLGSNAAGQWRAFRWTESGGMQDLGTLPAMIAGLLVFPPTAPWWSARLSTPQGIIVPFAGRRRVGCKTSARWAAIGARLMCFRRRRRGGRLVSQRRIVWACLSLDGGEWVMQDLGTLPGYMSALLMVFPPTAPWWSAGLSTAIGRRAFRWTAAVGCKTSARWL
jgi:hypothetical protein